MCQQEIGVVAASAERKFYDRYPNPEDWTSQRVDDIVGKAVTRAKVHFKSELKKILPIADPQNTPAFLAEVKTHYECRDDGVEMKLEKLWMLAVSAMDPSMKVLWLERWNQPTSLRVQLKFPKQGFNDDAFYTWLNKATWWAQVCDSPPALFVEFSKIVVELSSSLLVHCKFVVFCVHNSSVLLCSWQWKHKNFSMVSCVIKRPPSTINLMAGIQFPPFFIILSKFAFHYGTRHSSANSQWRKE